MKVERPDLPRTVKASLRLETSGDSRDEDWDAMLGRVPEAHFEQSSGWAVVKQRYGWKVRRLRACAGGEVVGGMQVLTRAIGRLGTLAYVSRGPVVLPGHEGLDRVLIQRLDEEATRERWLYVVFDYPYRAAALAEQMRQNGYRAHPPGIPPSGLMTATTILNLRLDENTLLAGMNRKTRRYIRKGQNSGLTFSVGVEEDLVRFRELMLTICARRHSAPTPPQKDFFLHLWRELAPRGWAKLFVVRKGEEMVCSLFAFTFSDTIRVWKVGWSGDYTDSAPTHLLYWEIMRWAKAQGFKEFDFVWLAAEDAQLAAEGETDPSRFHDGTTFFKLGFGGRVVLLPPVQSRFYHPLANAAYCCGGARILSSSWVRSMLARYWSGRSHQ
jgi:lipid II:glycine glycyltransferase (peptidoglycan interpeptide bridge formation enzyme)